MDNLSFYRIRLSYSPLVSFSSQGFTLVQAIVDIAILAVLLTTLVLLIDPVKQFGMAKDSTRSHDLQEIKNALDTYYSDHNCYPTTLPFNNRWEEDGVTYMSRVPQDSDCSSNPEACYMYQIDTTSACPQWNILYSKKENPDPDPIKNCPLQSFSTSCTPPNYNASWSCVLSGSVNCPVVVSSPVIPSTFTPDTTQQESNGNGTSDPGDNQSCPQSERRYLCSGTPQKCNVVAPGSGTYCSSSCDGAC